MSDAKKLDSYKATLTIMRKEEERIEYAASRRQYPHLSPRKLDVRKLLQVNIKRDLGILFNPKNIPELLGDQMQDAQIRFIQANTAIASRGSIEDFQDLPQKAKKVNKEMSVPVYEVLRFPTMFLRDVMRPLLLNAYLYGLNPCIPQHRFIVLHTMIAALCCGEDFQIRNKELDSALLNMSTHALGEDAFFDPADVDKAFNSLAHILSYLWLSRDRAFLRHRILTYAELKFRRLYFGYVASFNPNVIQVYVSLP